MSKMQVLGISLVVLLVALPLVSIGSVRDSPELWGTGLVLLVLGAVAAPITRFVFDEGDEEEESQESQETQEGDDSKE